MNKTTPFDQSWINSINVNKSAVLRRAQTLGTRRSYKKEAQAAVYLRAIECMDYTTLKGDDTVGKVERLCAKAKRPVEPEILGALGLSDFRPKVGAVCVYYDFVAVAARELRGSGIPVAAVSAGFTAGKIPHDLKLKMIEASIADGADEIDIVIDRGDALQGLWRKIYSDVSEFRKVCGDRIVLKSIIGAGDLGTLENVAKATACVIMAGSDFAKTSTGYETTNATLDVGLTMARQIRKFYLDTRLQVGFKAAGGIREAKDALLWFILMKEELADLDSAWLTPKLFRLGASDLLTDLEMQLEHCATGRYSSANYHPKG